MKLESCGWLPMKAFFKSLNSFFLTFFSDDRKGVKLFFKAIDFNGGVFFIVCISISTSKKASLSIYQIRHDCQSIKSSMSLSPSNQACLSVHQVRHIRQSIKSGMSGKSAMSSSPSTLKCMSVPGLQNLCQSRDSKIYVSPASLKCMSAPGL